MSEDNLIIDTEIIEVEGTELYTVDSYNAFSALGEPNEQLRHQLLNGRDMSDQHPITAITGLRDELNSIEALQTVYSDKKQIADYYKWEDGNRLQQDRVGYFVSLCEDVRNIKICSGGNIFGVTIDDAAFIGGQDNIPRDIAYGLVLYTGVAYVRCESDVSVGDCVISNAYGMARKSQNNYGYKVIAISNILGVKYAIVTLNLSIGQIDLIGENLNTLVERMDTAEKNIVTATNKATDAYNKAESGGSGNVSEEVINNITSSFQEDFNIINESISDVNTIAGEAKTIANNAIANVEAVRVEAIEKANQVFSDVSGSIADLDAATQEIRNSINNVNTKAQSAVDDLIDLKEEMTPLSEWTGENGNHSFTGFVDKVNSHSATLADLAVWQGTVNNGSIESIAGIQRQASANKAALDTVASYTYTDASGETKEGLAGLMAQVNKNGSELSTLASYEYTENGEVITSGLAGLIQQVNSNASSLKMLAGFEDENVDGLAEVALIANNNKSAIEHLTSWSDGVDSSITSIQEIAEENQASISQLTSVDTELKTSMATIQQQSDENGASIQLLAASIDKYSAGQYSPSYGLTESQAKNILKDGMVYVPTTNHSETFSDTNKQYTFAYESYYIWNSGEWVQYSGAVAVLKTQVPSHTQQKKYWYVDTNNPPNGYEPHTLYMSTKLTDSGEKKWIKVSTSDNSNRAISLIRQTQNEIALEVSNVKGSVAGFDAKLENNKQAYTQMVSSVVDSEGKVNTASIVAAVNNGASSVAINGNHIVLNGATTNGNGTFKIDTSGHMEATGGKIGGWSISSNALKKVVSRDGKEWNYYMQIPDSDTGSVIAVRYGEGENPSTWTYPFRVNAKGELTASKANITGGSIKIGDDFEVTSTGKVYAKNAILKGSVYLYDDANSGNIKAMYADGGVTFPTSCYFEDDVRFDAEANFHYDISFAINRNNPGYGACIYSGESIYITTKGTGIHTVNHDHTVRLSNNPDNDGIFQPGKDNVMRLGSSNLRWTEVYAGTGAINTSDRNKKDNIEPITDIHEQFFMKLLPVSYTFKDGTSGRTHIGFVSQDVESAMEELGMTSLDFAGFCRDIKMKDGPNGDESEPDLDEDGNIQYLYSLRYSEFIALNTHMIQKLSQRTNDLEERVAQLEELIKEK